MCTIKENNQRSNSRGYYALVLALLMTACSTMPDVKDTTKIDIGMNKKQVIDILGEPLLKKIYLTHEIFFYNLKGEEGMPKHCVAFEDNGVIYSGSTEGYRKMLEAEKKWPPQQQNTSTSTSNPTINVNPTITVNPPQSNQVYYPQPAPQPYQQRSLPEPQVNYGAAIVQGLQGFYNMQNASSSFTPGAPMRPTVPNTITNPYDPAYYGR